MLAALVIAGALSGTARAEDPPSAGTRQEIAETFPPPAQAGPYGHLANDIRRIYEAFGYREMWRDGSGTAEARHLLDAAIAGAHGQGLTPFLNETFAWIDITPFISPAKADVLHTTLLYLYADAMHNGIVPHAALGTGWKLAQPKVDIADAIVTARDSGTLGDYLKNLHPPHPQYAALVQALARYRDIAARGGWKALPAGREIEIDATEPWLDAVIARLVVESELPPGVDDPIAVRAAVRQFQERTGLDADGRVGPRTLAALNVPVAERLVQLAVNLERWRHLPRDFGATHILVNIPAAALTLVDAGKPAVHMRAIVGRAQHPTPVMSALITAVTVNPAWTVPRSIAVNEILPKLRRNAGYLRDNEMTIVNGPADDPQGLRIDWASLEASDFSYVFRQRPGTKNPLGAIKFEMSNSDSVYLHDTATPELFARGDRSLSHGCVRVAQPEDLACRLLAPGDAAETKGKVAALIAAGETSTLTLRAPVPVFLLYFTAFIDPFGRVNFRPDIYKLDDAINTALTRQTTE